MKLFAISCGGTALATSIMIAFSGNLVQASPAKMCEIGDASSNWMDEARKNLSLSEREGEISEQGFSRILEQSKRSLCVRKNNYWCQKHIMPNVIWDGASGENGCRANRDIHNHAIFASADFGARAGARAIRTSFLNGRRTALQIAERRSPSCDTLGSKGVYPNLSSGKVGKSCKDGEQPPASWHGPLCPLHVENSSQCVEGCNCPPKLAEAVVRDFPGLTIKDDLPLFDADCNPLPALVGYLRRQAYTEIGLWPRESLVRRGIALMGKPPLGSRCR